MDEDQDRLGYESDPSLPSYTQVRAMAQDMYEHLATNHTELWCNILYRLMMHTRSYVLFPLTAGTYELLWALPYPLLDEELYRVVDPDEAYRMGLSSNNMPLESTLTLHSLLSVVEAELGPDHADMQPVHRLRRGLRERAQMIAKGIDLEDMAIE